MEAELFKSTFIAINFQKFGSKRFDVAVAGAEYGDAVAWILLSIGIEVRRRLAATEPNVNVSFLVVDINGHRDLTSLHELLLDV